MIRGFLLGFNYLFLWQCLGFVTALACYAVSGVLVFMALMWLLGHIWSIVKDVWDI